jgi:sigma-E factor negative regulatory protein RseB
MRYVALFAVLALPQAVWSQQDDQAWLDKMNHAVQTLSYEGTFVFMHGGDIDTMHIIHGHDEGGVKERLISLNGKAREFIRDEGVLTCVWPSKNSVIVERTRTKHGIPATLPSDTEDLDKYYRFNVDGKDRIAGKFCRTIAIKPKDDLRYGHRLCIAENSGMLLKSVMFNAAGAPIEEVMFTNLNLLKSIPDRRFKPTLINDAEALQRAAVQSTPLELKVDPGWQIQRIPPGFKVTANTKRIIAANPTPVQHMILTDGLASVSVFIAKPQSRKALFAGTTHSGALSAYARDLNNYQITVVGEVPEETVKMIGKSIAYRPGAAH